MPENKVQITLEAIKNIKQELYEKQKDEIRLEIVCNLGSECRRVLEDLRSEIDGCSPSVQLPCAQFREIPTEILEKHPELLKKRSQE